MTGNNDRQAQIWAMWCHLSALAWLPLALLGITFPFLNIAGPLIVWLMKKDEYLFVNVEGKEALNFQISFTLYNIVALVILGVLGMISLVVSRVGAGTDEKKGFLVGGIGLWLLGATVILGIFQLILVIIAAVKANNGEYYRYPLAILFFR